VVTMISIQSDDPLNPAVPSTKDLTIKYEMTVSFNTVPQFKMPLDYYKHYVQHVIKKNNTKNNQILIHTRRHSSVLEN
jgi:hypothetical protein